MAYQCELCDKKLQYGRQHTHHTGIAGGQWKRRAQKTLRQFRPNIHFVTLSIKGIMTRVKACAKCIKRVKFDNAKVAAKVS